MTMSPWPSLTASLHCKNETLSRKINIIKTAKVIRGVHMSLVSLTQPCLKGLLAGPGLRN